MRNTILAGLALTALAAATPAAAESAPALMLDAKASALAAVKAASQSGGVRVWVDNHRDFFRSSDRLRVRVRSEYDAYLAVFHIDTNGDVDILFPRSESDDGWVPRGRTLTLGSRGRYDYLNVRGGHGVGYVMAVALEEPLELWRVRDLYRPRFTGWDGDRSIYGDPFYAMDEIVRAVVPETSYGYESVDYYTYHIGRRYDYPRYACYDGYGDWYHDTYYSYYGRSRCDRVRIILIHRPWYYDTYRWRGSRRVYYDRYYYRTARSRPLHGYKERTQSQAPPARSSTAQRRPEGSGGGSTPAVRGGGVTSTRPESTRPAREGTVSTRRPEIGGSRTDPASARRPETSGRATPSSRPDRGGTYEPRVRDRGQGRGGGEPRASGRPDGSAPQPRQPEESAAQPQQDKPVEPARERPTFQRRPQERSAEPRRENPPARSAEPRRASPPARSAEPRRESPPSRSAEPRRESPPPSRSSEPRSSGSSSRGSGGGSRTRPN